MICDTTRNALPKRAEAQALSEASWFPQGETSHPSTGAVPSNPLALTALPRGLTPAKLAGGFGVPDGRPLASRIERTFLQRVQPLPRDAQLLLLTAAAEPLGDLGLLWRAAEILGIDRRAGGPAEAAGLIELDLRVRFPHPLVRSAVYRASDPSDLTDVHRALADSTDPDTRPRARQTRSSTPL